MRRTWRLVAVAIAAWGAVGCSSGIKEGGPPPNVGYVAPDDYRADGSAPPKAAPANPSAPR
jgi:hypothetical protein